MKKRMAPLALMAFCLSCTPTPFDLSLSQAARTVQKMTQDNASLITVSWNSGDFPPECVFYPMVGSAGFDYSAGMLAYTQGLYTEVKAIQLETDSGTYSTNGNQGEIISNPDPHAPAFLAWPAKAGVPYLFCLTFDALYPADSNRYSLLTYDTASHSFTAAGDLMRNPIELIVGYSVTVIGASVTAESNTAYDLTHWLVRDDAGTGFLEVRGEVSGAGLAGGARTRSLVVDPYALSFLPANLTRCMYFYDENTAGDSTRSPNRSFASWYDQDSGTWRCNAWWEETPGLIMGDELLIKHRVDALLSSGQLLSTEDGTGRLYDRDGKLLATFPLGNLAYIGEQYVDGTARTYFSQCLIYDETLHFNVYWMETENLSTLDD